MLCLNISAVILLTSLPFQLVCSQSLKKMFLDFSIGSDILYWFGLLFIIVSLTEKAD